MDISLLQTMWCTHHGISYIFKYTFRKLSLTGHRPLTKYSDNKLEFKYSGNYIKYISGFARPSSKETML